MNVADYPVPLTAKQAEASMQAATLQMLGLNPEAFDLVRIGWETEGQPFGTEYKDLVYLRMVEADDEYGLIRDSEDVDNNASSVGQVVTYNRVWEVFWVLYGPNSFDNARRIRSALFSSDIHDQLAAVGSGLYLVTDPGRPRRVPELIQHQWWERVDFEARFNELVYEPVVVGSVSSAEIIIQKENGLIADIKATKPVAPTTVSVTAAPAASVVRDGSWIDPENAGSASGFATISLDNGPAGHASLLLSDFSRLQIPVGARITGYSISANVSCDQPDGGLAFGVLQPGNVLAMMAENLIQNLDSSPSVQAIAETVDNSIFGLDLTPADLNDSTFAVVVLVTAQYAAAPCSFAVNSIRLSVTYVLQSQ